MSERDVTVVCAASMARIATGVGVAIAGEAAGPFDALGILDELQRRGRPADAVLIDLPEHPADAAALVALFRERHPRTAVVAAAWTQDVHPALAALGAGAADVVAETAAPVEIARTVRVAGSLGLAPERPETPHGRPALET